MSAIAAVPTGSGVDPCCCGSACNVISRSLCSDALIDAPCGFPEFTSVDPLVEASCPPKFYRTKTVVQVFSLSGSEDGATQNRDYTVTTISRINDECIEYLVNCYGSHSSSYTTANGGTYSCSGEFLTEDSGDGSLVCYPKLLVENGVDLSEYNIHFQCGGGDGYLPEGVITETTTVSQILVQAYSTVGVTVEKTTTTTLSDEITLEDSLALKVCNQDRCFEAENNPECRYCCTDRGGGDRDGFVYTDSPEGCIVPGSSSVAWNTSPCDGSGKQKGQSVSLSLWFKGLVPGTTYRATITYKRCEFAKDIDDNYILPYCGGLTPCIDGVDPTEITDEIVFEATDWAEILSNRCSQCDILLKKCELEDEANTWNLANPELPPRTVACSAGGFSIPTASDHYTWFDRCQLEVVV